MAGRCFEQIHKNVKSSSDYTRTKRLKQRWCELYQLDPFDNKTKYAVGIRVNGDMVVLTAPSQGELLELVKAKYVGNPSLTGADMCIYNAQAGNLITYNGSTKRLQFNTENQFWRCANSDPMHGFAYPSTVDLSLQAPNGEKNIPEVSDGTNALIAAVFGKGKIR